MGLQNRGSAGSGFDLIELAQPLEAKSIPTSTITMPYLTVDGSVDDSPFSREILLDDSELIYAPADKTVGVSWANSGSVVGSDLTYVDEPIQEDHFHFPGTNGNTLQVPDSAALDLAGTTSMSIVVRMAADWTSESRRQAIVAKRGASQSWEFVILGASGGTNSGHLMFKTAGSVTDAACKCSAPVPFIPGETGWVKVTWSNSDNKVHYFIAEDKATEPITSEWYEIGSTNLTLQASAAAVVATTDPVYIGGIPAVGATSALEGRIYYLAVRDSGGTEVLEIDVPVDCAATTPDVDTSFTATSGQTVTINKSGTPPATCRLHNTLDVTLWYPWYEVALPPEINTDPGEILLIWATMQGGTGWTRNTQIPIISVFGLAQDTHQGFGIHYSTASNKLGVRIPSYTSGMVGSTTTSSWSSALDTASNRHVFDWLYRVNDDPTFYGSALTVHSGSISYGGQSAFWGTPPPGGWTDPSSGHKIRILESNGVPFTISEIGFKMVTDQPPSVMATDYTVQSNYWTADGVVYGKALAGTDPFWYAGRAVYFSTGGTPLWLGKTVEAGDWAVATNGALEPSVVWEVSRTPNYAWFSYYSHPFALGDDLVVPSDENLFGWIIVSSNLKTTYYDVIQAVDVGTTSQLLVGLTIDDPDSGTGFPYLYMEIDGSGGDFQWIEFYEDPDWRIPNDGGWGNPIILAFWLERTGAGINDRFWVYTSGMDDWVEADNEATFEPGSISIDTPLFTLPENQNLAIWGFGLDHGINVSPAISDVEHIYEFVVAHNQS